MELYKKGRYMKRAVFFVSDSTGITVEALGNSVLSQFPNVEFIQQTLTFIDDEEKAKEAASQIKKSRIDGNNPILFHTFADESLGKIMQDTGAMVMDCLKIFTYPLETELGVKASHSAGSSHSVSGRGYQRRIDALNFAMNFDDGAAVRGLEQADIILVGVSRSGKTPTSLYLALHFGIFAANYPLVDEDLTTDDLPNVLSDYRDKIYGLTISPTRLSQIREQRRPDSKYAELSKCEQEVKSALRLYDACNIVYFDSTHHSVEELSSKILKESNILRHID